MNQVKISKISTSGLLDGLFKTHNLESLMKHFDKQQDITPFHEHISRLCAEKGVEPVNVIDNSGIERTYGYRLFGGSRNPSRDKVIQIAFGFGMDYDETQDLLKVARKSPLYPKVKRDAVIIYVLRRGLGITEVQATLDELSLPILGKEERNCE